MSHNRDMLWDANSDPQNRRILKVRDMVDTHIANILKWIENRPYDDETRNTFKAEAEFRKLPKEFLDMAPFPKDEWGMSMEEVIQKRKPLSPEDIIRRRIDSIA